MADDICLAVEDCFADQNSNLVNWFRREPCEFHHPLTENDVKVEVRDDIEAIYYFLHYCNLQYALTGNNSILDTVAIEKQIDNYYDQMGTLVERSASTSGDTDLYDREIKKLCDKIEALRETLKTEQSKSIMTEDVKASIDRILGYLSKTDERSFLTYDDVTIRRLVECIVVHPEGKISVTLKGGFRGEETI